MERAKIDQSTNIEENFSPIPRGPPLAFMPISIILKQSNQPLLSQFQKRVVEGLPFLSLPPQ